MALVTLFAIVGDDLRIWLTMKNADFYFDFCLLVSMALFCAEIIINSIVTDGFKYSFFFWLDIIATITIITDINAIMDFMGVYIIHGEPSYLSANARPDVGSAADDIGGEKIQKLLKSLRLIRLIRIIKLYKYVLKS